MQPEPSNTQVTARLKKACAIALWVFVGFTICAFIGRESGVIKKTQKKDKLEGVHPSTLQPEHVQILYLHGKVRCSGCKAMTETVEKVVSQSFHAELKSGRVHFKTENFDLPGNEAYRRDYGVTSPTVLLVNYSHYKATRWKELADVWQLDESDGSLQRYIREETSAFLSSRPDTAGGNNGSRTPGSFSWLSLVFALGSAFGMGTLATISPCAFATNAVAISFLGRGEMKPAQVVVRGIGYASGRMLAYVALGAVIVSGLLSASFISKYVVLYMNSLLGPLLVVASLFLFNIVRPHWGTPAFSGRLEALAEKGGIGPALALGIVLALAFCPMSAAMFFGGLLPLAVKNQSYMLLPFAFGLATALPAVVFAALLSTASGVAGKWFKRLKQTESALRLAAAVLFLVVGIYYSLRYVIFQG